MASVDKRLEGLSQKIDGDILTDSVSRMLYATDASPYQHLPVAVSRPRHAQDCAQIVLHATRHKLPIIPRGAGTSLAGQCVGEGLIIDVSRYMNRIIDIDIPNRQAIVEPGVVCEELNRKLKPAGLMFAPDPSTSQYCNIGGMAGNNASGIHSLRYGTTRDNVIQIEAVLSGGRSAIFGPLQPKSLKAKLTLKTREGDIYRTILDILNQRHDLIKRRFPAPDGILRNAGYPLDVLTRFQPWRADGPLFNLAPFLCGTEGTLALNTAIHLKLVPIPQQRVLVCAHYDNIDQGLRSVPAIMELGPAALEMIDHHILKRTEDNFKQKANRFWLDGNPAAVLLAEFHSDYGPEQTKLEDITKELQERLHAYSVKIVEPPRIDQVWALRRAGLGLLMGIKGPNKAVTGIEDTAVKVADLAHYVAEVKKVLSRYQTDCVVYGSAGRGNLHLRPELNLTHQSGQEKYRNILDDVFELVVRFGGSITAKHGDGRIKAYYLERLLGAEILGLLNRVKQVFDPLGIFNPNKIIDAKPPDQNLRASYYNSDTVFNETLDWTEDHGFKYALQKCNGAGVCLQRAGRGTMCPSYMATREEKHSTRGRANILRQLLSAPQKIQDQEQIYIKDVLDLCLGCKGCKSECPANVDMARMKAEFMQQYNDRFGISLRSRIFSNFDTLSRYGTLIPKVSNAILSQSWIKHLLGLHPQQQLPQFTDCRFSRWWASKKPIPPSVVRGEVVLIVDPFSEYFEPAIAIAAVSVLRSLDYQVIITPCISFGRAQVSQGMLRQAKKKSC